MPDYSQCGRQGPEETPLDYARNLWCTTFMGARAVQFHVDFLLWEYVCERTQLAHIVELGSAAGGLSLLLALECCQRGWQFTTFDKWVTSAADTAIGNLLQLRANCVAGDLWGDAGNQLRALLRAASHPLLLLCDNGEKPREFRSFVPFLQAGDYVAVHDWNNEFGDGDIPDTLRPHLEPYMLDECNALGSLTRLWRIL